MKATIRHTGIVVQNIQKSLDFWCDTLGFRVTKKMEESGKIIDSILNVEGAKLTTVKLADENGNLLELLKFHTNEDKPRWEGTTYSTGLTHIALNVNNLSELYLSLSSIGYKFNAVPQVSDDGLVKVTYMHGPEGLLIELVEAN
jgi:catechol 2,3-dioxygenase-like lactoylglutathione lyase family enzyme